MLLIPFVLGFVCLFLNFNPFLFIYFSAVERKVVLLCLNILSFGFWCYADRASIGSFSALKERKTTV